MALPRRSVLAGLAALPVAMLPACLPGALAAEVTPAEALIAPLAFEPAAFIADLKSAGYGVIAYYAVPRGGETAGPPGYLIRPPRGRGFGAAYTAVMAKWWDAMDACPDHVERVVDHVFAQAGSAA